MESIIKISANPPAFNPKWISEGIDEPCVNYLENMGFYLCDKKALDDRFTGFKAVTTSQLRNVFEEVRRIQIAVEGTNDFNDVLTDVLLLRPKIAYNAAKVLSKTRDSRIDAFRKFAESALLEVTKEDSKNKRDKYKRFCQMMEGIIAYHKVYGGRD
ncbi:MAG TPA: type III-A CRISPR-associated protein Csm2 [Chitinophagales bacterium]|nr:type III-A CRISPR-associated protein Csm2 [Chitinophagales bacterium]